MNSVILAPLRKRQLTLSRFHSAFRQKRFVLLAVFLVAFLVRLGPLAWYSVLRGGPDHYDGGVYFGAAQRLIAGQPPYRDFVLLHPPGIALAMAPFAVLGHFVGDANAFAAARLLIITVGAVNAALVAWIAGRQGVVAGAVGGLLYAVWWPAAGSETTVVLEPFMNFLLLLAVALLTSQRRPPARTVVAGLLMGASVGFKLWSAPVVLVLIAWVFWTSGLREVCRFVIGCAVALVAVVGPFLAIAPRQLWNMVMIDQITRQHIVYPEQSIADRLLTFAGASSHLDSVVPAALVYLAAAAAFASIVLLVRTVPHGWLWCGIFCVQVAELLMAPVFFAEQYPAFAAGSCAVLIGLAAGRAAELLGRGRRPRFAGALAITLLLALFFASMAMGMRRAGEDAVDTSRLHLFANQHRCVWATSTVAIIADQESLNIGHGCGYQVDWFGLILDDNRAQGIRGEFLTPATPAVWQRQIQEELARSDAAITNAYNWQFWSIATRAAFLSRFKSVGHAGSLQLWSEEG